ncbi:hypothetical protein [Legionella taurinensis]|uniref:Uncharacterized protein n=1 Tax=Legionella taurinensis TaxID=70611 RepID=A0A3A5L6C3_9GAMM|nr:hypothetical protein [Legionella taurinensis]RJT48577.1 hypothetical protein D6J04_02245 [Legionella taurinensis]RJT69564.1 hypothetical protein D6J03_00050 [Legionella taurinensis]STY25084.1 Uncharacterised protein [Legionella taurinensis]
MPIQLTPLQRRTWASSPSELSAFLINISEFIIEISKPKALKDNKPEYTQLFSQVSTKILQYISSENSNALALSGAYFRYLKKEGLMTWTVADNNALNALLGPYRQEASASVYLKSFCTEERSASDAHCAFLRTILFADLEPLVAKNKQLDDFLASAIKVIDFLTTPYIVLFEEAEAHKKTTSGTDLQWSSMQKGLKGARDALLNLIPKSVPPFKKPISSKLQAQTAQMDKDLQIFQSCLAVENVRLETQAHYQALLEKYQRLQQRHEELSVFIRALLKEPLGTNATLEDYIRAYGEHWQASYEKLKVQQFKQQYEASLAEQENLRKQIKEQQAEIEKLVHKTPPLPLKQPLEDLKVKCDKLAQENKALIDKASELANAQSLMTSQNNPQKMSFIAWIKNLLNQLKNLQQTQQQSDKAIATLKQNNKELAAQNQQLKDQLQTGFDSSPAVMHPQETLPQLETWEKLLQQHCTGTNSAGVKEIMAEIKKLQKKAWPETEKLSMLSLKMREIAASRKDSHWSKSHFFGKGRHQGVQSLYTLMADEAFSLHNKAYCNQLQDLFTKTHFVHDKEENREEQKPLLIQ